MGYNATYLWGEVGKWGREREYIVGGHDIFLFFCLGRLDDKGDVMPLEDETTVPDQTHRATPTLEHIILLTDFYLNSLSYSFLVEYFMGIVDVTWNDTEGMVHIFLRLCASPQERRDTYQAWYSEAEGMACYIRNSLDQDVMLTLEFY